MKNLTIICIFLSLSSSTLAQEVLLDRSEKSINSKDHITLEVGDNSTILANITQIKKRRNASYCPAGQSNTTNKFCQVKSKRVAIKELSLNDKSQLIYQSNDKSVVCGELRNLFFGSKILLNGRCQLRQVSVRDQLNRQFSESSLIVQ